MKKKEDFIKNLDLFGESYTINNNTVLLNTGTPLSISVTFEEAKYSIEGKLIRWNFLTGLLKMSLRSAHIYLTVLIVLLMVLAYVLFVVYKMKDITVGLNDVFFSLSILIMTFSWYGVTFSYYISLYNHKKRQIINWLTPIEN